MGKHQSSSCGVFGVLQGIKLAKNGSKIPDNSPKYKAIKYSGGLKTFANYYEWVYIVETSMPKHYSSSFGVF